MAKKEKNFSRRDFLKTSGIATGALIGGGLLGGLIGSNVSGSNGASTASPTPATGTQAQMSVRGLQFFKNDTEFQVLSQAAERIFPEDDLGPGAIGLGVPYFIDHQLAGAYGENSKEYMLPPFHEGESTQGYQSRLRRNEMFRQGLILMQTEAQRRFNTDFVELDGGQMDEILTAFQEDELEMKGVSSLFFFRLFRMSVLEGAYADPIYGGNQNMEGWRMKGFPGHQASYLNQIESEEFVQIDPKSIGSMDH